MKNKIGEVKKPARTNASRNFIRSLGEEAAARYARRRRSSGAINRAVTAAILSRIKQIEGGADVNDVFRRVRLSVRRRTKKVGIQLLLPKMEKD